MNLNRLAGLGVSALLIALSLNGCGGGGGDNSTAVTGTPEGVYEGNTSNGKYFNTIVLENNQYYTLYGIISGGVFGVQGLMTGTGTANNGSFSSTNLKDFFTNGASTTGTLTASYVPGTTFNGSVIEGTTTVSFTGSKPTSVTYNYNTAATLTNIVGSWTMTTLTGAAASLTINTNGNYTATSGGCSFSGNITPRSTGKNVFDVTVTFGGSPCVLANQTASGNAVEYLLSNGKRQLIIAGSDSARSNATVLLGAR